MDIRDGMRKVDELIALIETDLPKLAQEVVANDLVALITNRVTIEGKDSKGNKFSDYSDKEVAAANFIDKSRTQSANKKVKELAKAQGALSYKGFRKLNGLKVDKKNFEFTGGMWQGFGVLRVSGTASDYRITMGGKTPDVAKKIAENSYAENVNIIAPSDKEIEMVKDTLSGWLERQLRRVFGG